MNIHLYSEYKNCLQYKHALHIKTQDSKYSYEISLTGGQLICWWYNRLVLSHSSLYYSNTFIVWLIENIKINILQY